MNNVLGLSSTVIMVVLLAALAVALVSVASVAIRNRIIFEIGVRNIPRRRAQSLLIVAGLMLSTVIIAAALTTGDTVNYTITNETFTRLGRVDQIVQVRDNQAQASLTDEQLEPSGLLPVPIVNEIFTALNGNEDVDGVLPGLRFPVPASDELNERTEPQVVVMGLQPSAMAGFEDDVVTLIGAALPVTQLRFNEAYINESTAIALSLEPGERINLFIGRVPRTLTVAGIVQDRYLTGWTRSQPNGVLVRLDTAQQLFGTSDAVSFVAISNTGGVRNSVGRTNAVATPIEQAFEGTRFEIVRLKQDRVERAEEVGASMAQIFLVLGLFSIAAGSLLVFLILVMLAAERRAEMGMARAVGMTRLQLIETFLAEGMAYTLAAAAAGAALGVLVSLAMTRAMAYIFDQFDASVAFNVTMESVVIAFCLGVVLTFLTVTISAWRVSKLSIATAVRDLPDAASAATGRLSGVIGGVLVASGVAFAALGMSRDEAALFGAGISLAVIGAAFVLRAFGQPERPVFSISSVAVLILWFVIADGRMRDVTGPLDTGVQTFFVGGVLMVTAATILVLYNADVLLGSLRVIGVVFARALPAVRTSIAYPLANKFRTGMTIAMLSIVVFSLVMISTLSLNFRSLFLDDNARGGWDVIVDENLSNPLGDANGNKFGRLGEALDRAFYDTGSIESVGEGLVSDPATTKITQVGPDGGALGDPAGYRFNIVGADPVFLAENRIELQARAEGYESDRAVWDAVEQDVRYAVIDGSVVPGINYANVTQPGRFTLTGYESGTQSFQPFAMRMVDSASGKVQPLVIIGIMKRGPSETFEGLYINVRSFNQNFEPFGTRYFVRLVPGADAAAEADEMEQALAQGGVKAFSIQERVEEGQQLSASFFYLVQGFMALGLIVGLASLTVIAFRTVVERRQQIGLMRAIGFSRANIALSFVLESAFVAVLGIAIGTTLALLLANRILQSDEFSTAGFTAFHVPWLQIALMAALVFVASVLTTIIPSRQASGIPPAEALRYE